MDATSEGGTHALELRGNFHYYVFEKYSLALLLQVQFYRIVCSFMYYLIISIHEIFTGDIIINFIMSKKRFEETEKNILCLWNLERSMHNRLGHSTFKSKANTINTEFLFRIMPSFHPNTCLFQCCTDKQERVFA